MAKKVVDKDSIIQQLENVIKNDIHAGTIKYTISDQGMVYIDPSYGIRLSARTIWELIIEPLVKE